MGKLWLKTVAVVIGISGIVAWSAPASASAAQERIQTAPAPDALDDAFDAYMQAAVQNAQFSGTVLVAKGGVPIFRNSYGLSSQELSVPNTDDTVYQLQSITKSFTAILIMMLQEEGKLNVTDRACDYLTDCPDTWKSITIQQLLTHTSGIEGYSRLDDWDETLDSRTYWRAGVLSLVRDRPLLFAPGEGYSYSNSGYTVLAQIIERASGKTLPEMYQDRILTPLGMNHTRFSNTRLVVPNQATGYYSVGSTFIDAAPESLSSNYGAGGIVSTVDDLLIWDQSLYSNKLISNATYEQMIAHTQNDYGYGWEIQNWFGHREIGHAGSGFGFSTIVTRFIDDGLTVVVLSNSDEASAGGTARALAAIYFGEDYRLPTPKPETIILDTIVANGIDAGIRRYQQMKAAEPSNEAFLKDDMLVSAGYELYGVPEMDKAKRLFEFTIEAFPMSAYSHDGLADIAVAEGDYLAAAAHFEASLRLDPENDYAVEGLKRVRERPAH